MTATVTYESNLRTTCLHLQSGSVFETDAPTDNKGKGECRKCYIENPVAKKGNEKEN